MITFGPDELLYVGMGDGGGGGDQHGERGNGQALDTLLGKILRIDPRATGTRPYTIPADNPFVGRAGARGEIYAYGLRNPWRFSFDRTTGDLTIGDVGQNEVEEIDFVRSGEGSGANFGWRVFEGSSRFTEARRPRARSSPVIDATHADGYCSITGGYVVRDPARAELFGEVHLRRSVPPAARGCVRPAGRRAARQRARGAAAVLVRRGRAGPRVRAVARRAGLPSRRAMKITHLRAPNPSPLTLSGTNTYVVDGAWVVDPGPLIDSHLDAIVEPRVDAPAGILLTHSHADHSEAAPELAARLGRAGRREGVCATATRSARSTSSHVPGHADDHLVFVAGRARLHRRHRAGRGQRVRQQPPERVPGRAEAAARAGAGADLPRARRRDRRPRRRSSTSTSPTAPSASASCWPRWSPGSRTTTRTRCSTPPGTTRPPPCARSRRSRCSAHLEKLREDGRL